MNDPKPVYANGAFHVYFQNNPFDTTWGPMHWGHGMSQDLLNWKELDIAIRPGGRTKEAPFEENPSGYDALGIWTGSVVFHEGTYYAFYTSISNFHPLTQTQSVATSQDLITWVKHPRNPLIAVQPEGTGECFRDPQVWREGDSWKMVVGSQTEGGGCALLYESPNLIDWAYLGVLYQGKTEEIGFDMECPDFFELDGRWVLLSSRNGTHWLVGDYDGRIFNPTARGDLDRPGNPAFGASYAPKTCRDPQGKRILFAWVLDELTDEEAKTQGWRGALSLARELRIVDGELKQIPAVTLSGNAETRTASVSEPIEIPFGASGMLSCEGSVTLTGPKFAAHLPPGAQIFVDVTMVECFYDGQIETYRVYENGLSVQAETPTRCQWTAW